MQICRMSLRGKISVSARKKALLVFKYKFKKKGGKNKMKYAKLKISRDLLELHCDRLASREMNPAYVFGSIIVMLYYEDGEEFATLLELEDYLVIRDSDWVGFNGYIVKARNHRVYLHRLLCDGIRPGMVAHHLGCRFDNRRHMLKAVTPAEHDRHRTYCGDLVIE